MEYCELGKTGIKVSRLCIGSLTVSPMQANLSLEEGSDVLAYAFENGINFTDTAQYYDNYRYIRRAIEKSKKYDTIISTKTYAYNRELAEKAFDEARRELNRDYIDIFMLHEQESIHTLRGHLEAAEFFFEMREKGLIKAVGASMHCVGAVEGICELKRLYPFSVIHPLYNKAGLGIADGNITDMQNAMRKAKALGVGIFSMKALGGGNLISSSKEAFDFVLDSMDDEANSLCDSVAVGMQSIREVDANISYFNSRSFGKDEENLQKNRKLLIEDYCEGCGKCVERCRQKALRIENGKSTVDKDKCLLCGYCAGVCPLFAIKVI